MDRASDVRTIPDHTASMDADVGGMVVIDTALPGAAGLVAAMARRSPAVRCIVLAVSGDADDVIDWAEARIAEYVRRDAPLDEVVRVIRHTVRGADGDALTAREREILEWLSRGCSNKNIAGRLNISVATVKNHVHSILGKLNVRRRGEAVARYLNLPDGRLDVRHRSRSAIGVA